MITLTRLSGSPFVLNSDLIERIDATPDSVVTLVDGKKYVVAESLQEIVDAVREYRGTIIAVSAHLADEAMQGEETTPVGGGHLAPVATLPTYGHGEA